MLSYPVGVIYDNSVGIGEIDSKPASSGTEQEDMAVWTLSEHGHLLVPLSEGHGSIKSWVDEPPQLQVVLQYVQHTRELREDQSLHICK